MRRSTTGFTIVELLIVITVIAILAVITIVVFNGVQARAADAAVTNDFNTINKQLKIYHIDNERYPTGATSNDLKNVLEVIPVKLNTTAYSPTRLDGNPASNILYIDESGGQNYAVVARVTSKKLLYYTSINNDVREYTGTYAANFPAITIANLAADIGLNNTSLITYYVYSSGNFRIWT